MIIACPKCSGKFRIDASALGASGRTVRCSKCAHTWTQLPPDAEGEPALDDVSEPAAADPIVDEDEAGSDSEDDGIDWDAPADQDDDDDEPVRPSRRRRTGADGGSSSRWPTILAWASLVVVVGGLVVSFFEFRDDIMDTWPETAGLYDLMNMAQPGFGLVLAAPQARQMEIDGATALVIEGRIENPTSRARKVPKKLHLQLFDKDQKEIQSRMFDAPVERLMPEQSATYKIELKDPAEKREILKISFTVVKK